MIRSPQIGKPEQPRAILSVAARISDYASDSWTNNRLAIIEALAVFLPARIILSILAVFATAMLPEQHDLHAVYHLTTFVPLDVWARWDSVYYLQIAQYGYGSSVALHSFFPMYPIVIFVVSQLLFHQWVLSGVVVSSVACFVALIYLFKLTAWEFGEETAKRAILYLIIFPTAVFLMAAYSESLFLALTVAGFYYARRGQWTASAIITFLAGLSRANALVLCFPLLYEAWEQIGGNLKNLWYIRPKLILPALAAIAAAPLGLLCFASYLALLTHDPLAFLHSEDTPPFGRHLTMPIQTLIIAVHNIVASLHDPSPLSRAVNSQDLTAAVLLIVVSIVSWWTLPRIYPIYLTAATLLILSSTVPGWALQSTPRFTLTMFPMYFVFARLGANRYWHRAFVITFATLLGMYTAMFATWYWVF